MAILGVSQVSAAAQRAVRLQMQREARARNRRLARRRARRGLAQPRTTARARREEAAALMPVDLFAAAAARMPSSAVARQTVTVRQFEAETGGGRDEEAAAEAMAKALRAMRRSPRLRAPRVTGALRKSMRVIDDPRNSRAALQFEIIYANSVDLRSKKNANYMQRVGAQAQMIGNKHAGKFWRFKFTRRVRRTTRGTGRKGWTRIFINYKEV